MNLEDRLRNRLLEESRLASCFDVDMMELILVQAPSHARIAQLARNYNQFVDF
jgi:hypothetical protein